ncbi:MAG: hypothetical protein LRY71_18640 [Bacillaceae bacterium]|nr:hypothetical protein [Bacillaceae bacterium]
MDALTIALQLLKGIGLFFFTSSFFMLFLFFSLYLGRKRVKRERSDFHTRVQDVIDDLLIPIVPGLLTSVVLSVIFISIGLVFPLGIFLLFTIVYFIFMLFGRIRLLSPAYVGGMTLVIALILPPFQTGVGVIDRWIIDIVEANLSGLALLVSILIMAEGVLLYINGWKSTSPLLNKSKRGKMIGGHHAQRVWILPLLLLIPSQAISVSSYWPIIPTDYTHVQFLLVPFAIGFSQTVRSTLPEYAVRLYGKRILLTGVVITILSVASFLCFDTHTNHCIIDNYFSRNNGCFSKTERRHGNDDVYTKRKWFTSVRHYSRLPG